MDCSGVKVLIMGLGVHGGGLESARYLLKKGARLTVTDLRDEKTLAASIEQLETANSGGDPIRYVLGKHEIDDFTNADMVIKNPGVRPDSPYLQAARRIETDISLFLTELNERCPARLTAVTGTKGKSGTASAIHWVLARSGGKGAAFLGGNITVSPLTFLDKLQNADNVTLELSSWQLGDLRGRRTAADSALLKPQAAVLTPIMPDHLDRYGTMDAYVADKRVIYRGQDANDFTVAANDDWGRSFFAESKACPLAYSNTALSAGVSGGWLEDTTGPGFARLYGFAAQRAAVPEGEIFELVPAKPLVPGSHQKQNLLAAGLALLGLGLPPDIIRENVGAYPGIEHRLELFCRAGGVDFYNDSAATIPEAAAAAIEALGRDGKLILVTGGTDKNLDFNPLAQAAGKVKALILLAGTGSEKIAALLKQAGIAFFGPFDSPDKAAAAALAAAAPGDRIALSPGCASFGIFLNEFDRGRKWKEVIRNLTQDNGDGFGTVV